MSRSFYDAVERAAQKEGEQTATELAAVLGKLFEGKTEADAAALAGFVDGVLLPLPPLFALFACACKYVVWWLPAGVCI